MQLKNRLQIPSNSSNLLSIPYITFSYAAVSVTSAIHSLSNSPDASYQVLSISFQYHETKGGNDRKLSPCIQTLYIQIRLARIYGVSGNINWKQLSQNKTKRGEKKRKPRRKRVILEKKNQSRFQHLCKCYHQYKV